MSSITSAIQNYQINDYERLGKKSDVYLAYDIKKGWTVRKLNKVQQIMRKLFGFYKETHFERIVQGLIREDKVSTIPQWDLLAKRINKVLYKKEISSGRSEEWNTSPGEGPVLFRSTIKKNNFLSNFFPSLVVYNDRFYSSSEVAYQAIKFQDTPLKEQFIFATAKESKLLSNLHRDKAPKDWYERKLEIMKVLVRSKFSLNTDLQNRLTASCMRPLVEHTDDDFWGDGNHKSNEVGPGKNHLGHMLEDLRSQLKR
jgi:GTP cyclohydrolase II